MARGSTPVVAVTLLVAATVIGAAAVGSVALGTDGPADRTRADLALSVDAASNRVALTHRGGPALNVSQLSVRVAVAGEPLAAQPPVPFFAAGGFRAGPTGPFNSGADPRWVAGERATFRIAASNAPLVESGDVVSVTVRGRGHRVARARTIAA